MQHKVKEKDKIVTKFQDFHNQSHDKFKADVEHVYNHSRAMEATLMETMVKVILNYSELFVAPTKTSYHLYILAIKQSMRITSEACKQWLKQIFVLNL